MTGPDETIFGRAQQLTRLAELIERVPARVPGFVLLTGEAGIGKSRILDAARRRAAGAGLRTLRGTAIESGRAIPYLPLLAPVRELLADPLRPPGPARRPEASHRPATGAREVLWRLLAGTPADGDGSAGIETARVLEALFEVLVEQPTLLAVDDAHWADGSTLMVLDYLAHRATEQPLLVLVAARDEVASASPSLPIADGRRFERMRLGRLAVDDVRRLAAAVTARTVTHRTAEALHRRAGGNPLFVEELLRRDADRPADARGAVDTAAGPVPDGLVALVARRVAALDAPAREVLGALAVAGRPVELADLATVAGIDAEAARAPLEATIAGGLAERLDAGYACRHPLFAEVIHADLAPDRRRALHAAAADVAERRGAPAAEIAEHRWHAGDPLAAWRWARAAAAAARDGYAFAEVRLHLERALATWPPDEPGRAEALRDAGHAAWLTGDARGALEHARAARALAPDWQPAIIAVATYAWDAGERAEAVAAFRDAWDRLPPDAPPATVARARWGLGRAAVAAGDPGSAERHGLDAARAAIELDLPALAAEGRLLAAMSRAFAGHLDRRPLLDPAVEDALRSGDGICTGHAFQFRTDLLGLAGETEAAIASAHEGIAACERLGLARSHGSDLRGRVALLLLDAGRLDEAEAILDRADPRAFPHLARALLAMRRGDFAAATTALDEAASGGSIGGPGSLGGWLELARVELAWLAGDRAGALAWLRAVPRVPGAWGADVDAWGARWAARLGDGEPEALAGRAARHPAPLRRAALEAEVAAALARGDAELWQAAADAWGEDGRPWEAAWAALEAGRALFAARDSAAGRAALERVLETGGALGSAPLRTAAEGLAGRARIRLAARGEAASAAAGPDEPTPRELEVLRLVADGLTNRQIGEQLFLSPKTVGIHVSRLLAKLGAHTRGEAAAIARRRGLLGADEPGSGPDGTRPGGDLPATAGR